MSYGLHSSAATVTSARPRTYFSLRRANRALVLVRRIVADLVAEYARAMELQEILDLERRCGWAGSVEGLRDSLTASVERIRRFVGELDAVGVRLHDFGSGAVDFPAKVGGREVCFCWRLDEQQISYWHGPDGEADGRRPLAELTGTVGRAD